jgi:hypothetical protein
MAYDNREVEKCLINKFGFTESTTHKGGHRWVEINLPGLPVITTFFSHTREDIRDALWAKIAKQLKVRKAFLNGMIDCHNSKQDYENQVHSDPFQSS